MADPFRKQYTTEAPAVKAFAISPHPTDELALTPRAVYIGGSGNLVCRLMGDSADVTFSAVQAGTLLPIRVSHIRDTSTASLMIGLI